MISCSSIFLLVLLLNFNDARVTSQNYPRNQSFEDDFIAYGRDYDRNRYPFVVSLVTVNNHQCTGTLLKPTFVLTAAHCTWEYKADDIVVILGAVGYYRRDRPKDFENIQRVGINIWQHEKYHDTYNDWHDISIIEISRPFDCPKYIEIGGDPEEFAMDRSLNCVGIGFGRMETEQVPMSTGKEYNCRAKHGQKACPRYTDPKIWKMLLCIHEGREQICSGDSGGPTICNGKQYAITKGSYGLSNKPDYACGDPESITLHMFLHYFRDWISAIIGPLESGGGGGGGGGGIGEQEEGHGEEHEEEHEAEHDGWFGDENEEEYEEKSIEEDNDDKTDNNSEEKYDEEYAEQNIGSTRTLSTHNYFLFKISLCILVLKYFI